MDATIRELAPTHWFIAERIVRGKAWIKEKGGEKTPLWKAWLVPTSLISLCFSPSLLPLLSLDCQPSAWMPCLHTNTQRQDQTTRNWSLWDHGPEQTFPAWSRFPQTFLSKQNIRQTIQRQTDTKLAFQLLCHPASWGWFSLNIYLSARNSLWFSFIGWWAMLNSYYDLVLMCTWRAHILVAIHTWVLLGLFLVYFTATFFCCIMGLFLFSILKGVCVMGGGICVLYHGMCVDIGRGHFWGSQFSPVTVSSEDWTHMRMCTRTHTHISADPYYNLFCFIFLKYKTLVAQANLEPRFCLNQTWDPGTWGHHRQRYAWLQGGLWCQEFQVALVFYKPLCLLILFSIKCIGNWKLMQ